MVGLESHDLSRNVGVGSTIPESQTLIHLPAPSKENSSATAKMGLGAEQAKTTSVSHNLLLVLEKQLCI